MVYLQIIQVFTPLKLYFVSDQDFLKLKSVIDQHIKSPYSNRCLKVSVILGVMKYFKLKRLSMVHISILPSFSLISKNKSVFVVKRHFTDILISRVCSLILLYIRLSEGPKASLENMHEKSAS